jgi:hypothetical protein
MRSRACVDQLAPGGCGAAPNAVHRG